MTTHEAPLTATGPTLCCNREPAELAAGDTFSTTGGVDCPGRPAVCPECQAGKHTICIHMAMNDGDEFVDCACGCEPSRTCPSCKDTVPVGWTLDDHFNCNWPEDFEPFPTERKENTVCTFCGTTTENLTVGSDGKTTACPDCMGSAEKEGDR